MASQIPPLGVKRMFDTIFGTSNSTGVVIFGNGTTIVPATSRTNITVSSIGFQTNLASGNILPLTIKNNNTVYFYKNEAG